MQGLIVENISNLYNVKSKDKIYESTARGKFKKNDILPVVGDIVEISIIDETNKKAVIEEIQPREVYIKRPRLSNITQIVFVVSSKDPKPDLLMLDKQLAFAEYIGVKAIIVLNKTDLDKKEEFKNINNIDFSYFILRNIFPSEEFASNALSKIFPNTMLRSAFSNGNSLGIFNSIIKSIPLRFAKVYFEFTSASTIILSVFEIPSSANILLSNNPSKYSIHS